MGNNFLGDPNCVAWYRFEDSLGVVDSKDSNNLYQYGVGANYPTQDFTHYKEASASLFFNRTYGNQLYKGQGNLSSDFPLRSDDADKQFSATCWLRMTTIPSGVQCVYGMSQDNHNRSLALQFQNNSSTLSVIWGYSGNSYEQFDTKIITASQWYHVAVVADGVNKTLFVRVWDDTAQSYTDYTLTPSNVMQLGDSQFGVGGSGDVGSFTIDGNIDELAIFNDLLTTIEIDAIRNGGYPVVPLFIRAPSDPNVVEAPWN